MGKKREREGGKDGRKRVRERDPGGESSKERWHELEKAAAGVSALSRQLRVHERLMLADHRKRKRR